jgi:HD superfamily phosphohydrolase
MQIFDPIHNFIPFNPIEEKLLSHPYMVRLGHIYQCGPAFHVYPGVTHTRFSHTIGVMHVASLLFDNLIAVDKMQSDWAYYRQAVRLGALLHDVGHYPLSHTVELFLPKHEEMVKKTFSNGVWDSFFELVATRYGKELGEVRSLVRSIALGESTTPHFLSQLIADPHFGADRIDYLLRDSLYSGLSYGKIDLHQLVRSSKLDLDYKLTISLSGLPSVEALLLARHWMHERLYQHHRVRSFAFHYAKVVKEVLLKKGAMEDIDTFMQINDHHIFAALEDHPEEKRAIEDPDYRVRALKYPIDKLDQMEQLKGSKDLWIDIVKNSTPSILEGQKVRLQAEEIFWVYTNEKQFYEST